MQSLGASPVRMLLERGCAAGQKDKKGHSALREAVDAKQLEAVSLLLQYGASFHELLSKTHKQYIWK